MAFIVGATVVMCMCEGVHRTRHLKAVRGQTRARLLGGGETHAQAESSRCLCCQSPPLPSLDNYFPHTIPFPLGTPLAPEILHEFIF